MAIDKVLIPEELLHLKPSELLESVPMSTLARSGTEVLQRLMSTEQAVAVKVQGKGAMVTLSQHQYDEMVALIHTLRSLSSADGFTQLLGQRFDALMARMNQPGAAEATRTALFADTASLNESYQPGETEDKD